MKEFLMLFRNPQVQGAPAPSAEQMQAVMGQWQSWIKGIEAKGKYAGTNRLSGEGKTIKPGNVITDGPYMEAKEMIGGYLMVKAESIDEAMEMAKSCPALLYGSHVEVRRVMSINSDAKSKTFLAEQEA